MQVGTARTKNMIVVPVYEKRLKNAVRFRPIKNGTLRATISTPPDANPRTAPLSRTRVSYHKPGKPAINLAKNFAPFPKFFKKNAFNLAKPPILPLV